MTTPLVFDASLRDRNVTSGMSRLRQSFVDTSREITSLVRHSDTSGRSLGRVAREGERGFANLHRGVSRFSRGVVSVLNPVHMLGRSLPEALKAGVFEAAGLLAFDRLSAGIRDSVKAASDLSESQNAVRVLFGRSADSILKWSRTTDTAFGVSQTAALEATIQFGDTFQQMGIGQKQSIGMSRGLVQLAADLGSFRNVDPSTVLENIASALRGEYDPIQRLIPAITAARVETVALAATHKTSAKELTAAEKATAVLSIIQKDGARSSGDFARTSSGLANQQRILAATMENTKVVLGTRLLPIVLSGALAIGRRLPNAIDVAGDALDRVVPVVQKFWAATAPARSAAGEAAMYAISRAGAAVRDIFSQIGSGFNLGQTSTSFERFGTRAYLALQKIQRGWTDMADGFKLGLGTSEMATLGQNIYGLGAAVSTAGAAFQTGGLSGAVDDLSRRFPSLAGNLDTVEGILGDLKDVLPDVANMLKGNIGLIQTLATTWGGPVLTALRLSTQILGAQPGILNAILFAWVGMNVIPGLVRGISTAVGIYRGVTVGLAAAKAGETLAEGANTAALVANKVALLGSQIAYALTHSLVATFVGVKALEFATWVKSTAATVAHTAAMVASTVVTKAAQGATLLWTGAQWLLNAALSANPIGLVVIAVAALVAGIAIAWTHSEKFRAAIKLLWDGLRNGALSAVSFVLGMVDKFLGGIGMILRVMAKLPGPFGAPFKAAADAVEGARGKVKELRDGIENLKPKTVNVGVNITGKDLTVVAGSGTSGTGGRTWRLAGGGKVPGPIGGSTADKQMIAATAGEFVLNRDAYSRASAFAPGLVEAINAGTVSLSRLDIGGDMARARIAAPGSKLRFAAGGLIGRTQSLIRRADPLPYLWGGASLNSGFDCSGIAGAAFGTLTGRGGFYGQRYFTTGSDFGALGFRPGLGTFSIGVTPGRGHMLGNLAGLKFEARSTQAGILVGAGAGDVRGMARQYYLPQVGGSFNSMPQLTREQWSRILHGIRPAIAAALLRDVGFQRRDHGGPLLQGQAVMNVAGGRERVLNARQTREWEGGSRGFTPRDLREALDGMEISLRDPLGRTVAGQLVVAAQRGPR